MAYILRAEQGSFTAFILTFLLSLSFASKADAQKANFEMAERFTTQMMEKMTGSTWVDAQWIEDQDRFWYSYENQEGKNWFFMDVEQGQKRSLFNQDVMASKLAEAFYKQGSEGATTIDRSKNTSPGVPNGTRMLCVIFGSTDQPFLTERLTAPDTIGSRAPSQLQDLSSVRKIRSVAYYMQHYRHVPFGRFGDRSMDHKQIFNSGQSIPKNKAFPFTSGSFAGSQARPIPVSPLEGR